MTGLKENGADPNPLIVIPARAGIHLSVPQCERIDGPLPAQG
jgi:hypothetical protein